MDGGLVRGVVGRIDWGYYPAAAINGYTVIRSGDGQWSLRATVVLSNAYNLTHKPLVFVAPTEKGEWRWPVLDYELEDGALTAQLGPPLE